MTILEEAETFTIPYGRNNYCGPCALAYVLKTDTDSCRRSTSPSEWQAQYPRSLERTFDRGDMGRRSKDAAGLSHRQRAPFAIAALASHPRRSCRALHRQHHPPLHRRPWQPGFRQPVSSREAAGEMSLSAAEGGQCVEGSSAGNRAEHFSFRFQSAVLE